MSSPIRVLVVDDSAFVRRAVQRMLEPLPGVQVVGTAGNGAEAVRLAGELRPDVVVLDVNMPEMDGLEALRRIMDEHPTRVLMLSTLTQRDADVTLRALELGAVDFIDKASTGTVIDIYGLAPVLREKVLAVAGATVEETGLTERAREPAPESEPGAAEPAAAPGRSPYEVIAIGTSTGGPRALAEVLSRLPAGLGAGVVVAQHMPPGFTQTLAERLDRRCALAVREAHDGDAVEPGTVLIAPGGRHMVIERASGAPGRLRVRITDAPETLLHRPSVDRLLHSVAEVAGARAIGVVLTGMGDDGAHGLREMYDAGALTMAESEESAVIFGMPRAAAPAARRVLPLLRIGPALADLCTPAAGAEPGAGAARDGAERRTD